jgi:hypothetical protein
VLLTTLVAAVLIRADGFPVPPSIFAPILVLGFGLPLVWPDIRSVPAVTDSSLIGWRSGLVDGITGLGLGLLIALVGSLCAWQAEGRWPQFAPLPLGAAIGLVLGWQRTLVWLPITVLLYLISVGIVRRLQAAFPTGHYVPPEPAPMEPGSSAGTGDTPVPPDGTRQMTPEEILPTPPHDQIEPP